MGEKKPFHRGEQVFVRIKSPAGLITEQEARVKEMAGARDVALIIHGSDRIVKVVDVRKASAPSPIDWLQTPIRNAPIQQNGFTKNAPRGLSATLGESIMAKTSPPPHFETKSETAAPDTRLFCMMLRGARNTRSITREVMAQLLRVKPLELDALESGEDLPTDDIVIRLADVLDLSLDQLMAGHERSKEKEALRIAAKAKTDAEAAERAERKRLKDEQAGAIKQPTMRTVSELPRRTFEEFGERLMDVCPVPIERTARKQWYVFARALFDLENT